MKSCQVHMLLGSYNLRATKLNHPNLLTPPNAAFMFTKKTIVCGVELPQRGMHFVLQ
jgi:hypothetical protein